MRKSQNPSGKHRKVFWHRMFVHSGIALGILALSLGIGIWGYEHYENLSWRDAFLNAAMLLGGMGPVDPLRTTAGKWLAGCYALLAGVVFLVLAGVMLAPVIHHVLQRFHLESDDGNPPGQA